MPFYSENNLKSSYQNPFWERNFFFFPFEIPIGLQDTRTHALSVWGRRKQVDDQMIHTHARTRSDRTPGQTPPGIPFNSGLLFFKKKKINYILHQNQEKNIPTASGHLSIQTIDPIDCENAFDQKDKWEFRFSTVFFCCFACVRIKRDNVTLQTFFFILFSKPN